MKTNTAVRRPPVVNHEGTPVPRINAEKELWRTVTASLLWEDSFYESGETVAERIKTLTLSVNPEFAAALAREARGAMKLRHVPLWIARWLASGTLAQKAVVADLLADIIQRPDELTEFLSLYWKDGKTPLAACVKRGLARAFQKFSAYSLAKYNRPDVIKLRDVLFLVHAKPKDEEQAATWKQLVDRTLPTPDTWEVALSGGSDKKEAWTRLLTENKLGALALLRNLRNMQEAKVEESLIAQALQTCDTERVLPFRFIAAAKYAPRFEPFLEAAMFRSLEGQDKLRGRTALVVDTSPSMWMAKVSAKSEMDRFEAAAALAILCREVCEDVAVYAFNERAYEVPARRGFALRDALAATRGGASCGGLAVQMANERGYDRLIVLTDGQWHVMGQGRVLREADAKTLSPDPLTERAYMVNVANYQNGVGYGKWTSIDGWSEAIVTYIQAFEASE